MTVVYLGLGSNLGAREENLAHAVHLLGKRGVQVQEVSPIYETEPVGHAAQPPFLNCVCRAETEQAPAELLATVKEIEATVGRTPSFKDGPREIDVDILFYDDAVVETEELTVPHPRIAERAFVLTPLADVAPDYVHPVTGQTVAEMLAAVHGRVGVRLWGAL